MRFTPALTPSGSGNATRLWSDDNGRPRRWPPRRAIWHLGWSLFTFQATSSCLQSASKFISGSWTSPAWGIFQVGYNPAGVGQEQAGRVQRHRSASAGYCGSDDL